MPFRDVSGASRPAIFGVFRRNGTQNEWNIFHPSVAHNKWRIVFTFINIYAMVYPEKFRTFAARLNIIHQNQFSMKKLFTFLMAMIIVAMCFAQNGKYEVIGLPIDHNMDRSNWYGWYAQSGYVHTQVAESEYFLFLPAGTFDTIVTLEKVRFYTIPSENINNYTGDPFTLDNDFIIKIYTGSSVNGVDFNPGTPVHTQSYNPATAGAEAGPQSVTLSTPFTVNPTDNVTIGIYSAGLSSMGLCDDDATCANVNFALWPEYDEGIHHYYWTGSNPAWAYQNATVREHDPWNLSVFYNDGRPYTYICDWYAEIYDPDDEETYPDEVTHIIVDEYTDSLRLYCGMFNKGLDPSIGQVQLNAWIDDANLGRLDIFDGQDLGPEEEQYDSVELNTGWRIGPLAVLAMSENYTDFSFPFEMCVNINPNLINGYTDPNINNNTYCVQVGREEDFVGVEENTNTLNVTPNPASTTLNIENAAGSQIFVYNIAGQEVMSIESAEANETLNVSNLNAGLYIVRVVNGNEVSTAKVSIVR